MRTTRAMTAPALLACGALLAASAALTACSSGPPPGPPAAATAGTPDASTEAIVQCYRAHGDPDLPRPGLRPERRPVALRHLARLRPGEHPARVPAPVPVRQRRRRRFRQAQFQQLVRLAECMRQHGVPNWPDPDPDGSFPLPPPLQNEDPCRRGGPAGCQRYVPSGGIDAHAVS